MTWIGVRTEWLAETEEMQMDRESDEEDYRRDAYDERERQRSTRCQCPGEMPGYCPGPAYCPMCEPDGEE